MKHTISILGCGWLGLPLAASLIEKGFEVKGSTTQEGKLQNLSSGGIRPYLLKMTPELEGHLEDFFNTEYLVIAIPPQVRHSGEDFHPQQIARLIDYLKGHPVKKIIYISSTSVYRENKQVAKEEDVQTPEQAKNQALIRAENLLQNAEGLEVTILRCGGLVGYDRIPGKYFLGKKDIPHGGRPVNYVHRDDVIHVIKVILEKQIWGEVFNLVAPEHPSREEVYAKNAEDFGFSKAEFADHETGDFKIVDSSKLIKRLNYQFFHPDPLQFFYQIT